MPHSVKLSTKDVEVILEVRETISNFSTPVVGSTQCASVGFNMHCCCCRYVSGGRQSAGYQSSACFLFNAGRCEKKTVPQLSHANFVIAGSVIYINLLLCVGDKMNLTRKPCCGGETARCRCKFRSMRSVQAVSYSAYWNLLTDFKRVNR